MLTKAQLKSLRSLRAKKGRAEQGRFLIEGIHLCREALAADVSLDLILYTRSGFQDPEIKTLVSAAQRRGLSNLIIAPSTLASVTDTATPQGILAVARKSPVPVSIHRGDMLLLLDRVRDPGNVGTLVRTADAVGADGVFISGESADIYNPKTLRSTQGSIFHLPVQADVDPRETVTTLKSKGFRICIAAPRARLTHTQVRFPRRFVLVVGNETHGVSEDLRGLADDLIGVPLRGRAESLNVAMAGGVILYEALRQREARGKRKGPRKRRPR
jgi:TrmH family RNA methyltransferase